MKNTRKLTFSAIAIALATVTSMLKLFDMPMGGSVTLFSMFMITLVGYWFGLGTGLCAAIAYGLLQLIIDPYFLSIPQILIDYVFAFGAMGLSGLFANRKYGLQIGYLVGITGRFIFSVISGVVFFAAYAPEDMHPLIYSALYNGSYIYAEGAITLILISIPAVQRALQYTKSLTTGQREASSEA